MSIISAFKNIIKNNKIVANLYANYSNKSLAFNREKLFNHSKSSQIINEKEKKFFGNILNDIEFIENVKISKNINSVLGWVPYIKGKTNAIIYNFFSQNYALRKNILLRYSIINQGNIIHQKICWIKPQTIIEIKEKNLIDIEGQFLVVELFHPFIKNNHGGHGGHLRFWGKYFDNNDILSSITHSMPMDFSTNFISKENLSRSYFLKMNNKQLFNFSLANIKIKKEGRLENYGFGAIFDAKLGVKSVWHVAPCNNKINKKEKITHLAYCPKIENLDPYILIDDLETGVKNQIIEISVIKNEKVLNKKNLECNGVFFKKISEIFGKIDHEYIILISFYSHGHSYFNIFYNLKDNYGDCVHSHQTTWDINKNHFPKKISSGGNTRKFFFISKKNESNHILILNNALIENKEFINLYIRILTDNFEEHIIQKQLDAEIPCTIINIEKEILLLDNLNFQNAIIQLESYDHNVDGSMMYVNKNSIAIDHLTGG